MPSQSDRPEADTGQAGSRPQQPGEAATTRFGMEEGDNTDTPAIGGPQADDEESEGAA